MPYRCSDCARYFSLRTGTVMERSPIPLHKWMIAAFLLLRGKGVSSLQLARDLDITQKSAWFMNHRLREAMRNEDAMFSGPSKSTRPTSGARTRTATGTSGQRPTTAGGPTTRHPSWAS